MLWKPMSTVDLRKEFVSQVIVSRLSFAKLSSRYGVSRKTGYKWLGRNRTAGLKGLDDRSKKPRDQPVRLAPEVEGKIVSLRYELPVWGAARSGRSFCKEAVWSRFPQ